MTNNENTIVTYPVSAQVFESPSLDPLNDEAFLVVVAQPMDKTSGRPFSPLIEAGGLVVRDVLSHVMDASTAEMPPPPPLSILLSHTKIIPFPLPPPPLPSKWAPHTPLPQHRSPGEIPTTMSHSTGEKADCRRIKWFEEDYVVRQKTMVLIHSVKGS